jgi:predicted PurR-regulated permease PerM
MDQSRAVLLVLAGLLLVVTALLVMPFLQFFLLAVLLGYVLQPLQRRLTNRISPVKAAMGLVVVVTVVVVLPSVAVLWVIAEEAANLIERIRSDDIAFTRIEQRLEETTGIEADLVGTIQAAIEEIEVSMINDAIGIFGTLTHLLVGLGLTVFLLYYFLKDGAAFNRWLHATLPLPDRVQDELHAEFDDVMWAVLASHVFIAVVQGIVAGAGFVLVGIPNAILWTVVMVVLAILPIIGSFLVWGPAVLYLLSVNRPLAGAFLLTYGMIVVGLTDDYLRPIIIDRYTQTALNPGIILIGVLGGVYLLGFMGIFFGPIVVGSLRAVLDVYRREYVDEDVAAST